MYRISIDSTHDLVALGDLIDDVMMEVRPGSERYIKTLTDTVDTGWKIRELRIVVQVVHSDVLIKCSTITRINGFEVISNEQFVPLLDLLRQILEDNADTVKDVVN